MNKSINHKSDLVTTYAMTSIWRLKL